MRLRRSELSTPASNERLIEKASASDADLVFLDLEYSVAPNRESRSQSKGHQGTNSAGLGQENAGRPH